MDWQSGFINLILFERLTKWMTLKCIHHVSGTGYLWIWSALSFLVSSSPPSKRISSLYELCKIVVTKKEHSIPEYCNARQPSLMYAFNNENVCNGFHLDIFEVIYAQIYNKTVNDNAYILVVVLFGQKCSLLVIRFGSVRFNMRLNIYTNDRARAHTHTHTLFHIAWSIFTVTPI